MSYDRIKQIEADYLEKSKNLIKQVNKEASGSIFPQNILVYKMACDALESKEENATTVTIDGKFYFTEGMVNRLMLLAWHEGRRGVEERSYIAGQGSMKVRVEREIREMVVRLDLDIYRDEED